MMPEREKGEKAGRAGGTGYRWTLRRVALGVLIVGAAAAVIGFVASRELAALRDDMRTESRYADLVRRAADSQAVDFNFDNLTIPRRKIAFGGPRKDGIPALSDPKRLPPQVPPIFVTTIASSA